jgi:hypothetical protein
MYRKELYTLFPLIHVGDSKIFLKEMNIRNSDNILVITIFLLEKLPTVRANK